jgi:hypothetical protein
MMEPEDRVHAYLRVLVEEFYAFIVRESKNLPFLMISPLHKEMAEHECFNSLMMAVANDGSLAKFFPALREATPDQLDADSIRGLQTIIVWSDGSSEGMTPLTLCSAIISDVFRYLWSLRDNLSLNDALGRLPDSIALARNLAEKRPAKIPAVVSIHNMDLVGRSLKIGHGILRRPIRYDRFRLPMIVGAHDTKALILRIEVEFSAIHIRATSRDADRDEEQQRTQHLLESIGTKSMYRQIRRLQNEVNRACLAIALGSPPGKVFAPVQGWGSTVNPLSDLNRSQRSGARSDSAPYPSQEIGTAAERRAITRFASLIERHPDVLNAGTRRLLLAITERMYPEDAFVDAIICWENLFSGTPETSLRVCGAMAKLLCRTNTNDRREMYSTLSKLYRERNKIIHGSSDDIPENIHENRDLAIGYALDAFRAIYNKDDLLQIRESPERGLMVLLGR